MRFGVIIYFLLRWIPIIFFRTYHGKNICLFAAIKHSQRVVLPGVHGVLPGLPGVVPGVPGVVPGIPGVYPESSGVPKFY